MTIVDDAVELLGTPNLEDRSPKVLKTIKFSK